MKTYIEYIFIQSISTNKKERWIKLRLSISEIPEHKNSIITEE